VNLTFYVMIIKDLEFGLNMEVRGRLPFGENKKA
jgi:hypothetical protein